MNWFVAYSKLLAIRRITMSCHLKRLTLLSIVAVLAMTGARADAQTTVDRVRTAHGTETGMVTAMTPLSVTIDKASAGTQEVPVNEINVITFHGEPVELSQARVNARNGGYATALDALRKIDVAAADRDFIKQDVQFYRALCEAKLALGGTGEIGEAGRGLNGFVRKNPDNYHYLEAVEMMGDLLMASGKWESAQKQYAELDKAPWPDYRMRAAVLIGRTLQGKGEHAEAIAEFDKVLEMPGEGPDVESQKLTATLGKAESLAATGKVDDAVAMIQHVIEDANPEAMQLHARAYNALGSCYEQAGKTKDALLAYLHVDVLYNTVPEAHAEALSHLVPLWQAIGQGERAREAKQTLEEKYAGSRWAK
jgi:tetratricopeptide (TPR) repeat protein